MTVSVGMTLFLRFLFFFCMNVSLTSWLFTIPPRYFHLSHSFSEVLVTYPHLSLRIYVQFLLFPVWEYQNLQRFQTRGCLFTQFCFAPKNICMGRTVIQLYFNAVSALGSWLNVCHCCLVSSSFLVSERQSCLLFLEGALEFQQN